MEKGRRLMMGMLCCIMLLVKTGCTQKRPDYKVVKAEVAKRKTQLCNAYNDPKCDKDSVVRCAQQFLFTTMTTKVFPSWYGTKWAYHGTTEEPRKGKVACGYFVTTTIRDLGFDVPRVRWAQAASEAMIKEMTDRKYIKRYRFSDIGHIESEIRAWGDGLYVVGMDSHTGFIVNKKGVCRFVHSDYYNPLGGVISEKLSSNNPLKASKYRVIGKVLTDEMVTKWLKKEKFP